MSEPDEQLLRRAHADLANRARGGIVIYLLIWIAISLPSGLYRDGPLFFQVNLGLLLLVCLVRAAHLYCHHRYPDFPLHAARRWLVFGVLAGALHWGLMTAWIILDPALGAVHDYVILSTAVLGIAGTAALAISNRIRLFYPVFLLVPGIAAMLLRGETRDMVVSAMGLAALGYVMVTSRIANRDYWRALTQQQLAEQRALELEKLSTVDALTGLKNRLYFDQRFLEDWKLAERTGMPLSLLMLDIDHFKALNDGHGHAFGDYCLQRVARLLEAAMGREPDTVARYGGEEFVVLLPNTDEHGAAVVAERLRAALDTAIEHDGKSARLACSLGGATARPGGGGDTREGMLKRADEALYVAKASGRNRYHAGGDVPLSATG